MTSSHGPPIVELRGVYHAYARPGAPSFQTLNDVDLRAQAGSWLTLLGRSGSGKSTLLNLLAGLDRPTVGEIEVAGTRLDRLDEAALAKWRGRAVGVVFQFFQLVPLLTVRENLLLAMELVGVIPRPARAARAAELLALVEIADQADKLPATLSGGQQQRAAIARALANDPPLVLADEPTGNLDSTSAEAVLRVFERLRAAGTTLIVVTHDAAVARHADRVVELVDGRLRAEEPAPCA